MNKGYFSKLYFPQELHDMTGQHSMQTCPAGANTPVKMGNGHQEPTSK